MNDTDNDAYAAVVNDIKTLARTYIRVHKSYIATLTILMHNGYGVPKGVTDIADNALNDLAKKLANRPGLVTAIIMEESSILHEELGTEYPKPKAGTVV